MLSLLFMMNDTDDDDDVMVTSFGRVDHTGWCTHKAGLGGWNLFSRDFVEDKPTYVLETSVRAALHVLTLFESVACLCVCLSLPVSFERGPP